MHRDHPVNAISLLEGKQAVFARMKTNLGSFPFQSLQISQRGPKRLEGQTGARRPATVSPIRGASPRANEVIFYSGRFPSVILSPGASTLFHFCSPLLSPGRQDERDLGTSAWVQNISWSEKPNKYQLSQKGEKMKHGGGDAFEITRFSQSRITPVVVLVNILTKVRNMNQS